LSEFEIRDVRLVYEGSPIQRLEVHHVVLPNGVERRFELIRHPGAAAIVPLHDNGDVVLLRQLRYAAAQSRIYEIPAGKLSPGEAPEACARRELEEETGLRAGRWEELLPLWMTPGFCDERIWVYLARDLTQGKMAHEEDEVIDVLRVPLAEALAMIDRGEIRDAKTVCGLAAAALRLKMFRTE
jgi:ADP-ribose pyrophosphatase